MTYVTKIIFCAANPRSRAKLEIERYLTQGFIRNKIVDGRDRLPYSSKSAKSAESAESAESAVSTSRFGVKVPQPSQKTNRVYREEPLS